MQLGENKNKIFVIGSPDIDIMLSKKLPSLSKVRKKYNINFDKSKVVDKAFEQAFKILLYKGIMSP